MIRYALALALIVIAAGPAPAAATTYPGERPAGAEVRADVDLAVAFWRARGLTACPAGVEALEADSLFDDRDGAHAVGRGADCQLWVSRDALSPPADIDGLPDDVVGVCAVVVHEVGHALGLALPRWDGTRWVDGHPATGIMAAYFSPLDRDAPWPCRLRARAAGRRARARAALRHRHHERNRSWATASLPRR